MNMEKKEVKMTIEELSEEYVKSTLIGLESIKKSAFKAGANAVLKEIENVFTADYPSIFMATQAMRDKINELKGKE